MDEVIQALANVQHRVVSWKQLVDAGVSRHSIQRRQDAGWLRPIYRGVYLVGPGKPTRLGRWMAATLARAPGAVLSHRSAAALWGLLDERGRKVHVTVPRRLATTEDIITHFARLPFDEVGTNEGIPTTSVPRALADLAATEIEQTFKRALEQAEIKQLQDPLSLGDLLQRDPRRRGAKRIKQALKHLDTRVTKEEFEQRFKEWLARTSLSRPELNAQLGPFQVDALWPEQRLIVELDSRENHLTTFAFERDRERDRVLATVNHRVVRITWRQLHDDAQQLEADLSVLLAAATGP